MREWITHLCRNTRSPGLFFLFVPCGFTNRRQSPFLCATSPAYSKCCAESRPRSPWDGGCRGDCLVLKEWTLLLLCDPNPFPPEEPEAELITVTSVYPSSCIMSSSETPETRLRELAGHQGAVKVGHRGRRGSACSHSPLLLCMLRPPSDLTGQFTQGFG